MSTQIVSSFIAITGNVQYTSLYVSDAFIFIDSVSVELLIQKSKWVNTHRHIFDETR